jgi:hypothetical protein
VTRLLSQGEIEEMILAVADALEEETERYAQVCDQAARAEADWKYRSARSFIVLGEQEGRMTAAEKEHRVTIANFTELRTYRLVDAQRAASKEALNSLRARLDALRTLSANVRNQT